MVYWIVKLHDLKFLVVDDLDIIGREKPVVTIRPESLPPAWVYLVNVRDDLARVEGNLRLISRLAE